VTIKVTNTELKELHSKKANKLIIQGQRTQIDISQKKTYKIADSMWKKCSVSLIRENTSENYNEILSRIC
jgi:hypothetical protein